jgi:DNA-binding SARP family transcriptional activator
MPVEFRLLGPLEVRRDGVPIRVPSKQRRLLAALLLGGGRVVSIDRLTEALWPESAPADSRHALEMHASRLRSLLGEEISLAARAPGYVLDVDAHLLDSVRFERLLTEARELVEVDPARSALRAADALALWRGNALADFTFDAFAEDEIARLEELRLEAEELRVDAELRLGRAADLVGELEALIAAAPFRERRREQLMLGLYRSGRQADALAVYRDAHAFLGREFGIEPGQALRDLERAILQQDPALAADQPARVEPARSLHPASVVTVALDLSVDLDPEEHDRLTRKAGEIVAQVAAHYDARQPEPLVLSFVHEDHAERAYAAAASLRDAIQARIGVASGEALIGAGVFGGPLIERARQAASGDVEPGPPPTLARRSDGPFVGRAAELERLRIVQAAAIVGPAGIGKSRLAHELSLGVPTVVARCSSYGMEALAPLRDVAAALGDETELDAVPAAEVPLRFRRLCERSAPLLVVFDDVHWASQLVLETIEHLVVHGGDDLRILCLARDELFEDRPEFLPTAERLLLGPLTDEDATTLAAALGADDVAVTKRAEGNPLFIEQLLAHAAEASGPLPKTLQSLLSARLDRLAPGERLVVERAAVVGREFDAELVGRLLGARNPRGSLTSLVARGLLDHASPAEAFEERFRFRHALIHDAAYESIGRSERSSVHEAVADLLAERNAADELVGFHLEQAAELRLERDRHATRLAEDAGRRLGSAGIARWKRGDAAGSAHLLERATKLLPRADVERLELLCELGCALNTSGDHARAIDLFGEACEAGDGRIRLRAELEQAAVASLSEGTGVTRVLELATHAIPAFEAVGDDRALGRAWMLSGWVRGGAFGRHAEWLEAAERALVHYRSAGWPTATSIGHIAAALYFGPTPVPEAIARCRALIEGEHEDLSSEANLNAHLGGLEAMACDFDRAARSLARARAILSDLGRTTSLLVTCGPIEARVARLHGDLDEAARSYRTTCEALVASGGGFHLATQAAELADVLCELGRFEEAEEWASVAERNARASDRQGFTSMLIARSQLLAGTGDLDEAESRARAAIDLAELTDELNLRAHAHRSLARILDRRGTAEAAEELASAAAEYDEKGNAAAASNLRRQVAAATFPGEAT